MAGYPNARRRDSRQASEASVESWPRPCRATARSGSVLASCRLRFPCVRGPVYMHLGRCLSPTRPSGSNRCRCLNFKSRRVQMARFDAANRNGGAVCHRCGCFAPRRRPIPLQLPALRWPARWEKHGSLLMGTMAAGWRRAPSVAEPGQNVSGVGPVVNQGLRGPDSTLTLGSILSRATGSRGGGLSCDLVRWAESPGLFCY